MANSRGISFLARVLDSRMKERGDSPLVIDYGRIKKNGSLVTNSFNVPIPKDDFMVCSSSDVKKGDRVLVVWVQDDPVVIDRLKFGSDINSTREGT